MNPAIHAAIIAASQSQASEEAILARLRTAGALDSSRAIHFDSDKKQELRLLDKAIAKGTVLRTTDGRVYLDERAIADRKHGQGFMVLIILLIAASLIASGVALVMLMRS